MNVLCLFEIVYALAAMKKRSRESASPARSLPNAKKVSHTMRGIESPKRDGVNKSKPYLVVISICYFDFFVMFAFSVRNSDA